MGLEIKRSKKGLYQLKSTGSDEILHEAKWISEDEAKKILIERITWKFFENIIKIDLEFPGGYHVNGKYEPGDAKGSQWLLDAYKSKKGTDEAILEKLQEIDERLDLNLDF